MTRMETTSVKYRVYKVIGIIPQIISRYHNYIPTTWYHGSIVMMEATPINYIF